MRVVGITQRVAVVGTYRERRDCLDQAWPRLLAACQLQPLVLPNVEAVALQLCASVPLSGLIFTGGNDLAVCGGDAPERDALEAALLTMAEARALPVLGVCRGMQVLQHRFGVPLKRVEGHVTPRQAVQAGGERLWVNSYHHFGATETRAPLAVWATAPDGVIKAVRHAELPLTGIMWHPERMAPFAPADVALIQRTFGVG